METKELVEQFKAVRMVSDAVNVLDKLFDERIQCLNEIESIRAIRYFLDGLCVGESFSEINEHNPFHWYTMWNESIFNMFLSRHGYYLTNDNMLVKNV